MSRAQLSGVGSKEPPPEWDPDNRKYPLHKWLKDVGSWTRITELTPEKWVYAVERSLQGVAKDVAHNIPREAFDQGADIDGQFHNP